jgi:hypothetical protein
MKHGASLTEGNGENRNQLNNRFAYRPKHLHNIRRERTSDDLAASPTAARYAETYKILREEILQAAPSRLTLWPLAIGHLEIEEQLALSTEPV